MKLKIIKNYRIVCINLIIILIIKVLKLIKKINNNLDTNYECKSYFLLLSQTKLHSFSLFLRLEFDKWRKSRTELKKMLEMK